MQPAPTPETDPSFAVAPSMRHVVPWRVTAVDVLPQQRLRVQFVDGTSGEVDLRPLLRSNQVTGTVFEPLRDPQFFAQVRISLGTVQWPNGADLAPDAMYDAIREHGCLVITLGNRLEVVVTPRRLAEAND